MAYMQLCNQVGNSFVGFVGTLGSRLRLKVLFDFYTEYKVFYSNPLLSIKQPNLCMTNNMPERPNKTEKDEF